ncbi:MAG: hypothetical protein HQL27_09655 [Candidatus Omnitrophica bacterium]|nr:hypothetical protein [Candidatus Omnitrophota bacterium]
MLPLLLVFLGIASRLVFHTPNFTPVIAIALFSGIYVRGRYAVLLPVVLLIITDLFVGMHSVVSFTWGSMALIALLGLKIKEKKSFGTVFAGGVISAVLFFVVTNLGVWLLSGMYTLDLNGLSQCFTLAVPFFRSTLASTLLYTVVLYGVYEFAAKRLKDTSLASVL